MWWLILSSALAGDLRIPELRTRVLTPQDIPAMPPPSNAFYGVIDVGDVVVVRPQGEALTDGYNMAAMDDSIEAALAGRGASYDFVMILHTERLPTQFSGSLAFHLSYNNDELEGTGVRRAVWPERPIRAVLWMNSIGIWDYFGPERSGSVFGQELGHYWLAFPYFDLGRGDGAQSDLLGRDNSHWSYWLDTTSSPLEGNRWLDNGDGTFTTDPDEPAAFSPLDLYMMGLIEKSEVPPFFYIEPDDTMGRTDSSAPELERGGSLTVSGTRVEVTVDDIIRVEGERLPSVADSPTDFTILTMLVLTPTEMLTDDVLAGVATRQQEWSSAWSDLTGGRSAVHFDVVDEGRIAPPLSTAPTLVPRGAW